MITAGLVQGALVGVDEDTAFVELAVAGWEPQPGIGDERPARDQAQPVQAEQQWPLP